MKLSSATLINLAFRVPSLTATEDAVETTSGWDILNKHEIDGEHYLEAGFGGVTINFFEKAIYDTDSTIAPNGFLHASFQVPKLDQVLDCPRWKEKLCWGPSVIKGGFGHRRIAFFEPVPGCRIELMEDLDA